MIRHFVAFKFKNTVTEERKIEVRKRFLALKDLCIGPNNKPYITSIESGYACSVENLDQGKELGFLLTFPSEVARNYYVGRPQFEEFDPAHDEFKNFVVPLLETNAQGDITGAFVFDYSIQ